MIYLASPYSHPNPEVLEARFQSACQAVADLLRNGLLVFSPIVHSHHLVQYGLPGTWEFWAKVDIQYLSKCSVLIVLALAGWEDSVGVNAEMKVANEMGIPILFFYPSDLRRWAESQKGNRANEGRPYPI